MMARLLVVVAVVVVALCAVVHGAHLGHDVCSAIAAGARVSCAVPGIIKDACIAHGCCWDPAGSALSSHPNCFYNAGEPMLAFLPDTVTFMTELLLQSVDYQGTGALLASPSTSNPDYKYHWVRDASLTMYALLTMQHAHGAVLPQLVFDHWSHWIVAAQAASDPNGINVLGEPKFFVGGAPVVYDKPWGRPQNDGPPLRARASIAYARVIRESDPELFSKLWNVSDKAPGAINVDLAYAQSAWKDVSVGTVGRDAW